MLYQGLAYLSGSMECMKHGGKVIIKVNGPKRYSVDLKQGGMEVPAEFCFKTSNEKLFFQMKEKTLVEIEKFEEKRKQMEEEKKKKNKPKTDKKSWINNGNKK